MHRLILRIKYLPRLWKHGRENGLPRLRMLFEAQSYLHEGVIVPYTDAEVAFVTALMKDGAAKRDRGREVPEAFVMVTK